MTPSARVWVGWVSLFLASPALADRIVPPEVTTPIDLSNRDVNRIVCARAPISEVIASEEKGITITTNGSNAFVKYQIRVDQAGQHYVRQATELYVVCGGEVYTLIAQPRNMSAQTIRLSDGTRSRIEANLAALGALPYEERVILLAQAAYRDAIPDSFRIATADGAVVRGKSGAPLYRELTITRNRSIHAEGIGLRLNEYRITAEAAVDLEERDFLRIEFGADIAAVTVDPLRLEPGEHGRLLIVERVGGP